MRNQQQHHSNTNSAYGSTRGAGNANQGSSHNSSNQRGGRGGNTSSSYYGSQNDYGVTQTSKYYQGGEKNQKNFSNKNQSDHYEGGYNQGKSFNNGNGGSTQKFSSTQYQKGSAQLNSSSKRYQVTGAYQEETAPYQGEGRPSSYYGNEDAQYNEDDYYYEEEEYNGKERPKAATASQQSQKKYQPEEQQHYNQQQEHAYQKPLRGGQPNNASRAPAEQRRQDGYQDYYYEQEEEGYQNAQQDQYFKGTYKASQDLPSKKLKNYQEGGYHQPPSPDSYHKQSRGSTNQYGRRGEFEQRSRKGAKISHEQRGGQSSYYPTKQISGKKDSQHQPGDYYDQDPYYNQEYYYEQEFQEEPSNKKVDESLNFDKKYQLENQEGTTSAYQYRPKKHNKTEETKQEKTGTKQIMIQTGQGASKKDDIPYPTHLDEDNKQHKILEDDESTPMPTQPHRIVIKVVQNNKNNNLEQKTAEDLESKRQREDSNTSWATVEEQAVENNMANSSSTNQQYSSQRDSNKQKPSQLLYKVKESQKNEDQRQVVKQSEQFPPTAFISQNSTVRSGDSPNLRHQNSSKHSNQQLDDDLEHHLLLNIPDPVFKELETKKSHNTNPYQHQMNVLADQFGQQLSFDPYMQDQIANNWGNIGSHQMSGLRTVRQINVVETNAQQHYMQQHRQVIMNPIIMHQNQMAPIQQQIMQSPSPIMHDRTQYPYNSPQQNNALNNNSPYGAGGFQDPMLQFQLQRAQSIPVSHQYSNKNNMFKQEGLPQNEQPYQSQMMQYLNYNKQPSPNGIQMMEPNNYSNSMIPQQHLSTTNTNYTAQADYSPLQYNQLSLQHSHSNFKGNTYEQRRQQAEQTAQVHTISAQWNYNAKEFIPKSKQKKAEDIDNYSQNNHAMMLPPSHGYDQGYFFNNDQDVYQQQQVSLEQQQYFQQLQRQQQMMQLNTYGPNSNNSVTHNPSGLREISSGSTVLYDNSPSQYQTHAEMVQYQTQQQQQMMISNQNINNFQHPYYAARNFNQGQPSKINEYGNEGNDDQAHFNQNFFDPDNSNQPDVSFFNIMQNSPDLMQNAQNQPPNNGFNH